jgi:hypothetical protein
LRIAAAPIGKPVRRLRSFREVGYWLHAYELFNAIECEGHNAMPIKDATTFAIQLACCGEGADPQHNITIDLDMKFAQITVMK